MVLTIAVCAMPSWKVFIVGETNDYGKRIDGHWISRWDGPWMTCVRQSNHPMTCKHYSESLSITPDLKASRILMSLAVLMVIFAFINSLIGMLFNLYFKQDRWNRNCIMLTSGISYILAGILVFIPVTWTAYNIMRRVCFASCQTIQQQEIGEAILLGWPTVVMLLVGGSIFCWYHPCICRKGNDACVARSSRPNHDLGPEESPLREELRVHCQSRSYIDC